MWKKTRIQQDQNAALRLLLASAPERLSKWHRKTQPEKSNGSRILPPGSEEINKNETHNNKPTHAKKNIH
jgi:hypothetical protein